MTRKLALRAEPLEDRLTPAVAVRFDYRFDTTGFFNQAGAKEALERGVAQVASKLQDTLAAITPSGANTWTASALNSATGQTVSLPNLTVGANELVVFPTAGSIAGSPVAMASSGGFKASGDAAWLSLLRSRGEPGALATPATDIAPWGGIISFDSTVRWHFGTEDPPAGTNDFQSVALHEFAHLLGFGLGQAAFTRWVTDGQFTGPNAVAAFGGPVPIEDGHVAHGTEEDGHTLLMDPVLPTGVRLGLSDVELAVLTDIGWEVGDRPTSPPVTAVEASPIVASVPSAAAAVSVPTGFVVGPGPGPVGTAYVYTGGSVPRTIPTPFGPTFTGGVRVARGDVTGDGVDDTVVGTGPGVATRVRVFDGVTGTVVFDVAPFEPAFVGGVYVAVGDLNADGRAEVVVTPDEGGGPRVVVYDGATRAVSANFYGIDDPNFRGGARPAVGDVNGDGRPDLAVAAGFGGGPRVTVFDGRTVFATPTRLFPDFYAFEPALRNGVFLAVADVTGDGRGELIAGAGPGGGPRVTVFGGAGLMAGRQDVVANFFAGPESNRGGVRVAVADRNADRVPDIVTGAGQPGDGTVRVYSGVAAATGRPVVVETVSDSTWVLPGVYVG